VRHARQWRKNPVTGVRISCDRAYACLTLYTRSSPHAPSCRIWSFYRSDVRAYARRSSSRRFAHHVGYRPIFYPAFRGHWRYNPTDNRAIGYDFLLVIHGPYVPFQRLRSKTQNVSTRRVFITASPLRDAHGTFPCWIHKLIASLVRGGGAWTVAGFSM